MTALRDYLTLNDAAAELGLNAATLRQSIARGAMTAEKIGPRLWVVSRREVERYRAESLGRRGPRPAAKPAPRMRKKRAIGG